MSPPICRAPVSPSGPSPRRRLRSAGSTSSSTTSASRGIARFEEVADEEWDAYWQLNVMSYVRAIRAALPHLREARGRDRQRLLDRRQAAVDGMPHYSVTKAAVLSLSRLVADLYAKDGIRCNAVTPGPTGDGRLARGGRARGAAGRPRGRAREGRRGPTAGPARAPRRDRVGDRLPLLRASVVRDRRGVERRRRNGADHPLTGDGPRAVGVALLAALAASQAALVVLNPLLPDVASDLGRLDRHGGPAADGLGARGGHRGADRRAVGDAGRPQRTPARRGGDARARLARLRGRSGLPRADRGAGARRGRHRDLVLRGSRGDGRVVDGRRTVARPRDRAPRTAARMDRRHAARRASWERSSWRLAWLVVPVCMAIVATVLLLRRPATPPATARAGLRAVFTYPGVVRWSTGELLAFSGWAGALVYVGALLVDTYDLSIAATGLALGFGALDLRAREPPVQALGRHVQQEAARRARASRRRRRWPFSTRFGRPCGSRSQRSPRSRSSPAGARSPGARAGSGWRRSCASA